MPSTFTIGSLAKKTEVPASAIRYYERLGLLPPIKRSSSDYRLYDDTSVERLLFIREAHAAGFTLEDIKALLDLRDGAQPSCSKVRSVIEHRMIDVDRQMANLRGVRRMLLEFLDACQQVERGEECPVLESLTSTSRKRSAKRQGARSPRVGKR